MLLSPLLLAVALPFASVSGTPSTPTHEANRTAAPVELTRFDRAHAEQLAARAWPRDAASLRDRFHSAMHEGRLADAARAAAQLCARAGESCRDAERLAGNAFPGALLTGARPASGALKT